MFRAALREQSGVRLLQQSISGAEAVTCPECGRSVGIDAASQSAPPHVVIVAVCCECNRLFRVLAANARRLTLCELNYVKTTDTWAALRMLQLRNSCMRKSASARYN